MEIDFVIKSDYGNFFERLTKEFFKKVENPRISKVIVSAGPYRTYDLDIKRLNDTTIMIDYYSAIRVFEHTYKEQDVIDFLNKI